MVASESGYRLDGSQIEPFAWVLHRALPLPRTVVAALMNVVLGPDTHGKMLPTPRCQVTSVKEAERVTSRRSRDDFSESVKRVLANRAGHICSNPDCRRSTSGPSDRVTDRAVSVGDAAHITAAAPGGPRYDPSLAPEERRSAANGIWLCSLCARLIDQNGGIDHPADILRAWKQLREAVQAHNLGRSGAQRQEGAQAGSAARSDLAWFDISGGSWGSDSRKVSPNWMARRLRGEDVGFIEYRYRSRYHQQDWRRIPTHRLDGTYLMAEIDFSAGQQNEDPDIQELQLGLELRYFTEHGWRHELHKWQLMRRELGNPARVHIDPVGDEIYPPAIWYEPG